MYSSVFLIEELGILTFWLFLNGVFSLSLKMASALLGQVQEDLEVLLQCGVRGGYGRRCSWEVGLQEGGVMVIARRRTHRKGSKSHLL